MSSKSEFLLMVLDAPMQSWGCSSRFAERRATLTFPTKAGVVGIICAAMKIKREDKERTNEITSLKMDMVCFYERGTTYTDYQTIGCGYDKNDSYEKKFIPTNKLGKNPEQSVSERDYLCDYKFCIIVKGEQKKLELIGKALRDPAWGISCGRKCNIPTDFVFYKICQNKDDVFNSIKEYASRKGFNLDSANVVVDGVKSQDASDEIPDSPISFAERTYNYRNVLVQNATTYFKDF